MKTTPWTGSRRLGRAAAGAGLGMGLVAPAFAASFSLPTITWPTDWSALSITEYAVGLLVLLLITAFIVSFVRGHRNAASHPGDNDMRWWKNHGI
jgi:hypothetical protein